jgi:Protein of unknown function (DUF1573)
VRRASSSLLLVVLSAVFLLPVVAQDAPPSAKGPRLVVEPASFDFGKAVQNKTLQKEFSIRNFGGTDLVIENVSTTCGCTVAEGYAKVVKPGSSTPLRVSLETRNYSGKMERTVLIRSNDPDTSTTEVKVSVTVVATDK